MSEEAPPVPRIKVCGITREEDARDALALGADYLGINVWSGSKRGVKPDRARYLALRIPAGKRVMVDVNTGTDVLEDIADMGFDYFQIHFDLQVSWATVAAWCGIVGRERLWLAPRLPADHPFPAPLLEFADTIVLDTYSKNEYGGSGQTGDWSRFNTLATMYPHKNWVLAGGLNADNITQAIREAVPAIVDVNSGVESAPGIKVQEKMDAFFSAVRGQ